MDGVRFSPSAKSFNKNNLYCLARCSLEAYSSPQKAVIYFVKHGFADDRIFAYEDKVAMNTQGIILQDDEKTILAFRGTDQVKDWNVNLGIPKKDIELGRKKVSVHEGFHNAYLTIWNLMISKLMDWDSHRLPIYITGHSLGGALATLCAADLHYNVTRYKVAGVYTFGAPRAGSFAFADRYNAALKDITFRMVNNNDVVTRIPPQVLNFSHVGKLRYFDRDGRLRTDNKLGWWGRFWDRAVDRVDNIGDMKTEGIRDHSMKTYLRYCKELV